MQNLATFKFNNEFPVRTINKDDEIWFIAADVCKALNLENPTKAIRNLDADEKALTLIQGLNRGNEPVNIISESGMWTLVLRCRDAIKPGTVPYRFRKWVTSEVLPSIRKTGSYSLPKKQLLEPPKIANIPFNLLRDADYLVMVRNGKAIRKSVHFCELLEDRNAVWR